MNREQLKKELDAKGVDPEAYYFGNSLPNEKYVLAQDADEKWSVYFSERGARAGNRTFDSEGEACAYFLERILRDPTTRRR
jgi:hypothetical protein